MAIKKKASKKPAAGKTTAGKTVTGKKKTAKTASKKTAPKTKKAPSPTNKVRKKTTVDMVSQLKKVAIGVLVLSAVCLTAAMIADMLLRPAAPVRQKTREVVEKSPTSADRQKSYNRDRPPPVYEDISDLPAKKTQSGLIKKNGHPILYEVFEGLGDIRKEPLAVPSPPEDDTIRIALIIDDIGYDKKIAMALHALEPDISFSVLPWSPFGRVISKMLADRGAEIMLHLPMEPVEYPEVNPGVGALLTSMTPDVLIAQLEKNLMDISGVSGVNNHMGSILTTRADQMNQIFTILKKRNLFFIDSRTAKQSQCRASARLLQIRFAERDVFLDNFQDVAYISGQFAQLKKIAEKHGTAIGIGHPYPATLETLKVELPKLKGKMKIIRASQVVTIPG